MSPIRHPTCALMLGMLAIGAIPPSAAAQVDDRATPSSIHFRFDNDALAGTDRGYTAGATVSWASSELSGPFDGRWLGGIPGANDAGALTTIHLAAGQSLYTPDDLRQSELLADDRPYAGLLLFSMGATVRHLRHEDAMELTLGIVGPAAQAERSQRFIHGLFDFRDPKGWSHQLGNEPIIQMSFERRWMGLNLRKFEGVGLDVIPHLGGGAGNLTLHGAAGFRARVGWNLPDGFGLGSVRPGGRRWGKSGRPADGFAFQLTLGADGKVVLRDLLLDGNTFRPSHNVSRRPFTSDGIIGIGVSRGPVSLAYEHIFWTRRYRTESRKQTFSSFTLRVG